ncbi:hypothetical protein M8J75_014506 [Diaphorina citri]|nr:hypothetical protein M8J75_014506 [Diaphorina citri]
MGALEKSLTEKINAGFTSSRKDMKDVKDKIAEFETSLNFYGDQVDKAVNAVKVVEQNMILMENRLKKSESENKEMKARLRSMEIQVNGLNQKEFNTKIEISGIKDSKVEKDEQQAGPDTGCLGLWTRVAESAESAPKLQSIDTI